MSKNSPAYRHQAPTLFDPLPPGATTRILEILPGDGDVYLRLSVIELTDAAPYDALSYTWGDQSQMKTVFINDLPIPVTHNLYDALQSIRRGGDSRRLWVDALCINQADLSERSSQIPKLLRIYQTAGSVLVWLGEEDDSSRKALEHARTITASPEAAIAAANSERIDFVKAGEHALRELFRRSWFRRIWVIQEVSVGRKAMICIGATRVSW